MPQFPVWLGQQRLHHVCTARERLGQTQNWALQHVSCGYVEDSFHCGVGDSSFPGGGVPLGRTMTDSVRYSYFTPQFPWNLSCPPLLSGPRLALMVFFCGIISTYLDSRGEESTNTKNCRDRSRKEFRKITESPNKAGNSKYA